MCFAPQRRVLFRHRSFQKCSEREVFLAFYLQMCFRATTGVQFFTPHLASWLRTRRFSEPTFRPSGATNIGKTKCFATFLPLRTPGSSFFWCFLFLIFFLLLFSSLLLPSLPFPSLLFSSLLWPSLTLPTSAFHLSILSEVWLWNFLRMYMYTRYVYIIYI